MTHFDESIKIADSTREFCKVKQIIFPLAFTVKDEIGKVNLGDGRGQGSEDDDVWHLNYQRN